MGESRLRIVDLQLVSKRYLDDGVWRSWLARRVWDAEAGGSSPLTPTTKTVEI